MPADLPVIAAIPNYNMANQLKRLLPQVLAQPYDAVYVLDDASSDDSRAVVASFGKKVRFVAGKTNICSGGNRNRILEVLPAPAVIHFLDADTELISSNAPLIIKQLMQNPDVGLGGGLVQTPQGKQDMWNYGPRFSLYGVVTGYLQYRIETSLSAQRRQQWRKRFRRWLSEWPDIHQPPTNHRTFWVHEANMFIRSDVFSKVAGFDTHIRSHDIQDLAIRIQNAGYNTTFDPDVKVIQHHDVNVRPGNRSRVRRQASRYIIRKNGLWNCILPGGHFHPRSN